MAKKERLKGVDGMIWRYTSYISKLSLSDEQIKGVMPKADSGHIRSVPVFPTASPVRLLKEFARSMIFHVFIGCRAFEL